MKKLRRPTEKQCQAQVGVASIATRLDLAASYCNRKNCGKHLSRCTCNGRVMRERAAQRQP